MKILKNKKMRVFLMSQGPLNQKIRFLGQKMCPVGCSHTDTRTHRHTDGHTDRVTTVGSLSGFQDFFLRPIINDRPNTRKSSLIYYCVYVHPGTIDRFRCRKNTHFVCKRICTWVCLIIKANKKMGLSYNMYICYRHYKH